MSNKNKIKIASAFYSKPRKTFLPLTADDIAARTGIAKNEAKGMWMSMLCDGTMEVTSPSQGAKAPAIYELTPQGRRTNCRRCRSTLRHARYAERRPCLPDRNIHLAT
jgi:hypothetical protein